ncbi:C4-dicarboxylate-binding protein DctP [Mesorhizobium sp. J18]|uniref:TRAP transporter substrate-binding protein n=1 Tax=Mesorhizobium sp. J18 TaxID=935263 RepID=UPI0011999D97|nr:TRAP transporter substrate-binding protein [Mesorhizobium sp. J18]TWG99518.1 C4-dicarboxylate-binding protein DctP [Mesorhizobium sp. J18]
MPTRRQFIASTTAVAATLAMPFVARAQPVQMRLAHAANEIHPGHIAAVEFKKALEDLVPGAIEITIFPNRQLGDDKQNLESAMAGTNELCGCSGVLFSLVTGRVALDAYQLPFLIKDYEHFSRLAMSDIGQKILDDLSPAGLVGLQTTDIGQRHFLSATKVVKTVADFQGQKTRILSVPLHKAIWEGVGASPVGLPYGEVYGALETKVIDAVEINVSSMLGENLWEVGKNFTLTGHYPWHNVIAVNKAVFDGLPGELQEAMREAGRTSIAPTLEYTKNQDLEGRDQLRAKGVNIYELEDLAEMQEKVEPIVAEWSKKSPLIEEFVAAARSDA